MMILLSTDILQTIHKNVNSFYKYFSQFCEYLVVNYEYCKIFKGIGIQLIDFPRNYFTKTEK